MSLTAEQLEERRQGIGGSEAAAALGLSPWKTAIELYEEKRAGSPLSVIEPNEAMRWGVILEPVIRQEYANRTGRSVTVPEKSLASSAHPFMLATLDGIAHSVGEVDRLFEAKTARSGFDWGEPGTDQVPQHYLLQVQHYMVVTGLELADLAVLIGASDFRIYEIAADPELQQMIIEGEREFWTRVETGNPPAPDFDSPRALDIVRRLYKGVSPATLVASEAQEHWRHVYREAEARVTKYKDVCDGAKAHLLFEMGEASLLRFSDGVSLQRREVHRRGYTVPASTVIDVRFINPKD